MQILILSPDGTIFRGEAELVTLPGKSGSFQVLHNHAPLISDLIPGQIHIRKPAGETRIFDIDGGVVEILRNKITVLL